MPTEHRRRSQTEVDSPLGSWCSWDPTPTPGIQQENKDREKDTWTMLAPGCPNITELMSIWVSGISQGGGIMTLTSRQPAALAVPLMTLSHWSALAPSNQSEGQGAGLSCPYATDEAMVFILFALFLAALQGMRILPVRMAPPTPQSGSRVVLTSRPPRKSHSVSIGGSYHDSISEEQTNCVLLGTVNILNTN